MGKGLIKSDYGDGLYKVEMQYDGREDYEARIFALNTKINELQSKYDLMPENTPEEIFDKHIVGLQIKSLEKQVEYLEGNFPENPIFNLWCIDGETDLTGYVGLLEIPGEYQEAAAVNIVAGYESATFNKAIHGQLMPSIAMGPWSTFLNKCLLPGWQKWKPIYRYGTIINDSMDYENDKCDVCLDPAYSSQLNLGLNQNAELANCDTFQFWQMNQFCADNPDHPTCTNTDPGSAIFISDDQFAEIETVNSKVNSEHNYKADQSGYRQGDDWQIMGPGDSGDCEDFALTKMQELLDKGYNAKDLKMAVVAVETILDHAVLIINTANRGILVLDNRYERVRRMDSLPYRFLAYQRAGVDWSSYTTKLESVPIEYRWCNSGAFADGDRVVVKFDNQNFENPKVVGFQTHASNCLSEYYIFFGDHDCFWDSETMEVGPLPNNYRYDAYSDSWIERAYVLPVDYPNNYNYCFRDWPGYTANNLDNYWVFGGNKPPRTTFPPFSFAQPYPYLTYYDIVDNSHRYSKNADAWIDRANVPSPKRSGMQGFYINYISYLIGGTEWLLHHTDPLSEVFSDSDKHDDLTDTWSSIPGYKICRAAYWTIDSLAYIFGGNNVNVNSWEEWNEANFVSTLKAFNPVGESYQTKTGTTRWAGMQSFSLDKKGYCCGGRRDSVYTKMLSEYDADLDTWTAKQEFYFNNMNRPAIGVSNYAYVWSSSYQYDEEKEFNGAWFRHYKWNQKTDAWELIGEQMRRRFGYESPGVSL